MEVVNIIFPKGLPDTDWSREQFLEWISKQLHDIRYEPSGAIVDAKLGLLEVFIDIYNWDRTGSLKRKGE